ncbi:MAG: 4-hydroxythreonine-4-phosphate dehydrogenase PdxA [Bacteroidota bacterium]
MARNQNHKIKIGITIGDVNGIGPELVVSAFQDQRLKEICVPILYGSSRVINIFRKVMGVEKFHYVIIQNPSQAQYRKLNVIECVPDLERIEIGKPSENGGKAAYLSVKRAVEDAQHQAIDALITMPVDKHSFQKHQEDFSGHTELLAQAFNVKDNLMFMVADELRVGLVTNHLPISEVAAKLTVEGIVRKAQIMHKSLKRDFSIQSPMIALLGLNPHAGDQGLIGGEDKEIIAKAVTILKKDKGIKAFGPYPADGFFGSLTYRRFDGVLAMYHDQGLIPFKLLAGYSGVNFTAGIPVVRTSPDHGVAYDIAGKGKASAESLRECIYLTLDVFRNRKMNLDLEANALPPSEYKPSRHRPKTPPPPVAPPPEEGEEMMLDEREDPADKV